MRLFVAIVLPSAIRERLARTRDVLGRTGCDVKWVETENLHLTLKFLGFVEPGRLEGIQEELARVSSHAPFKLGLVGAGVFPNRRRPRVVWIGTSGEHGRLRALHADVERALQAVGFVPEGRPFSAHITLGRARSDRNARPLMERLSGFETEDYGEMTVDTVSLMESQLSQRGPTYRHVYDVSLRGAD